MESTLYNSTFCRLCGEENSSGIDLYKNIENQSILSDFVNQYLPLKIHDDGRLPRTICPGCHIQLQATMSFFDLIIVGQKKLRELRQLEIVKEQKTKFLNDNTVRAIKKSNISLLGQDMSLTALCQVMEIGEGLYTTDHEISLRVEGIDQPKRKRGRPRKTPQPITETQEFPIEQAIPNGENNLEQITPNIGAQIPVAENCQEFSVQEEIETKRRKRKTPSRYLETVQGKELERIFKEEGVTDEEEEVVETMKEPNEEVVETENTGDHELIGHMQSEEGKELGEVIVLNKAKGVSNKKKIQFHCEICNKTFKQLAKFLEHNSAHVVVKHNCDECSECFSTPEELETHQSVSGHTGQSTTENFEQVAINTSIEDFFKCKWCEKRFETRPNMDKHINAEHKDKLKKFSCPICQKQFRFNCSLKGHISSSHKNQKGQIGYYCDICGKRMKHPSSLSYHKEVEHNNGRHFACSKCGKTFKHRQLLRRHQLVHTEKRPYFCKDCNSTFKTKANLLNHQSTHSGEKKYYCELCGNQFAHKTSLTLHYRWHTGHKPFQCDVCKKSFSQKGNLQEHVRIHTGEKPFHCNICSRRFTTSSQFKLHTKRHTGERPWKCIFCEKAFLNKDTWKTHIRRHRGDRPFHCSYCSRDFPEMWALKKHQRLHTGERPYTCQVCGKMFADCSNLSKHKKVHEKENLKCEENVGDILNLLRGQVENDASGDQDMTGGEMPQIIYVTYENPLDPDSKVSQKYFVGPDVTIDQKEEEVVPPMEVMDEHGNPIQITMQDGSQLQVITTDGKNLHITTNDGQVIPVRLTSSDGSPLPAQLASVENSFSTAVCQLVEDVRREDEEIPATIQDPESGIELVTIDTQQVHMLNGTLFCNIPTT